MIETLTSKSLFIVNCMPLHLQRVRHRSSTTSILEFLITFHVFRLVLHQSQYQTHTANANDTGSFSPPPASMGEGSLDGGAVAATVIVLLMAAALGGALVVIVLLLFRQKKLKRNANLAKGNGIGKTHGR